MFGSTNSCSGRKGSYEIVSEELIYDGEEKLHRSQKALRVGTIALAALGDEDGTGAI